MLWPNAFWPWNWKCSNKNYSNLILCLKRKKERTKRRCVWGGGGVECLAFFSQDSMKTSTIKMALVFTRVVWTVPTAGEWPKTGYWVKKWKCIKLKLKKDKFLFIFIVSKEKHSWGGGGINCENRVITPIRPILPTMNLSPCVFHAALSVAESPPLYYVIEHRLHLKHHNNKYKDAAGTEIGVQNGSACPKWVCMSKMGLHVQNGSACPKWVCMSKMGLHCPRFLCGAIIY